MVETTRMTKLATKALGIVQIDQAQIVQFPEGLLGFPEYTEFALLDDSDESPFKWLQSTTDAALAFVVIQPELFLANYRAEPGEADLKALGVSQVSECLTLLIVTIPHDEPRKMTANLQGPILINGPKRIGRQVISNNDRHLVRVSILEQLEG